MTIYSAKVMGDFGATFFSSMSSRHVNHVELKKGWAGVDKPSYSEKQKEAFRRMMKKKPRETYHKYHLKEKEYENKGTETLRQRGSAAGGV